MDLNALRELIAQELFTSKGQRSIPEANRWPETEVRDGGVAVEAVEGIIEDVILHHGFYRVDPIFEVAQGHLTYGRIEDDGQASYLIVEWDPELLKLNPMEDIRVHSPEPFSAHYVEDIL